MADIIQLLPDHVANQIAAGEVVQRPASVVKELLENAIDANATVIKLIVKDAGKTLIQVIDDGVGMSVTDARMSFERHATSKIRSADDLFHLHTKGFRGEALASIAAIAHVELKTKQEQDEVGTSIIIEGSEITSQEIVVTPKGTSVSVKNLFYNIPARRNFLKSNAVELRHVVDEFHRVALAHPAIHFVLFNNGSEMFNLPAGNYRQRIVNIFGNKTNERLVPVNEETEVVTVSGFVGKPEFSKKTRGEQFFFVNHRFIKSSYLNHAVQNAFEGLIKESYYPSFFLYLEMDPERIDINIHPTKTEIKFDDEHSLYAILRSAVKHSLGQFNVAPVLDFDRDPEYDTPYNYKDKSVISPGIEVDRSFNPFKESKASGFSGSFKKNSSGWESLYVGLDSESEKQDSFSSVQFESEPENEALFETKNQHTTYQVFNKYIVSSMKSSMLIIDQNKAHQRILYEEYLKQMTMKETMSQQLLFPLVFDFNVRDVELLNSVKEDLEHTGLVFKTVSKESVEISGIPVNIKETEIGDLLEQLISDVENEVPESNFSAIDLLAKSMAKTLAIRNGVSLSNIEQEHLVNSLFACKEPTVSPFNKTTFVNVSPEELDKKFM